MEIHAPEKPIHSFREFLIQLLTVTVGILIALSLEGLLEWRHHRELAHEARTNIVSELRDNQRELAGSLAEVDKNLAGHKNALQFIRDMLGSGKSDLHEFRLTANLAQLNDASWRTAQSVGALSFLPYREVKDYATVYDLQSNYLRLQTETLDAVVVGNATFVEGDDPHKLPRAELEKAQANVRSSMAQITSQAQIGKALLASYDNLLRQHREH